VAGQAESRRRSCTSLSSAAATSAKSAVHSPTRRYAAPIEGTPFAYPLLATFLLTGARETEVYGLELDDVSPERKTITYRENAWRRLKTRGSQRIVPLWPQLEAILRDYLRGPHRPTGELLFPSLATGREAILTDTRKLIDHVAIRAGFWEYVVTPAGEPVKDKAGQPKRRGTVRTKALRHSYCAARLQTLDGGAPVSIYTVSRELGHTSPAMVQRV
jgi:integrase